MKFRAEKQALRRTNQELMDRLKKLWNCYKEKSLDRHGNSNGSDSSSASANNVKKVDDDVKVAKVVRWPNPTNCVLYLSLSLSVSFLSVYSRHLPPTSFSHRRQWRAELNNLQANVEFLTNRIDSAALAAKPADSYQYDSTSNDVIDPIISSTHSSPQNSNANFTQPERTVEDNANYAITNVTSNVLDTPSKTLNRSSSIKYVNDADDEPVYYNEPSSYNEQPAAYFEPAPGKEVLMSLHWFIAIHQIR